MSFDRQEKERLRSLLLEHVEIAEIELYEHSGGFAITREYFDKHGNTFIDQRLRQFSDKERLEYFDTHEGMIHITPADRTLADMVKWKRDGCRIYNGETVEEEVTITVVGDLGSMSNEDIASEIVELLNENEVGA